MLAESYNDIIIITIAQAVARDSSFSADTNMAETIVIARRLSTGERPKRLAYFVNLKERPSDKMAAQETAKSIRRAVSGLSQPSDYANVSVGDVQVGSVQLRKIDPLDRWTAVSIANLGLVKQQRSWPTGTYGCHSVQRASQYL